MSFFQSRAFKFFCWAAGLSLVAGLGAGVVFYLTFLRDLPDLQSIEDYRPALTSYLFDRNGLPIGTFYEERRTLVPIERVPKHVVHAFVAGEDSSFFIHSGIDYRSVIRAAWVNLRAGGQIRQGASTITQQMVKGLLLTPERKLRRKIREMMLARQIEDRFSKQEILYLYLNQIYFGHGAYGISEAARTYFGKDISMLSVSEGALLAGLPKAPSRYSPYNNPTRAGERRRYVLKRMHEEGYLSALDYSDAVAEDPVLADIAATRTDPTTAYFKEEVRRYLIQKLGRDVVMRGGLTIETTLDRDLQRSAVAAIQKGLSELDHRQGYRGPLRRVAPPTIASEIETLAEANKLASLALDPQIASLTLEQEHSPNPLPEVSDLPSPRWQAAQEALNKKRGSLLGVVTAVNTEANTADVSFAPGIGGRVAIADVRWAREPDPSVRPRSVKTIDAVFIIGDVARFSALPPEKPKGDEALELDSSLFRLTLYQVPEVQGALLSFDVASQEVLSMVGGYDFRKSQFNRATQARRQPGSAFKPLIYAAALAKGFTPATIIFDRPVVYTDEESGFIWRPRNYKRSFYGPITLREALARSVNNATVHLFRDIGVKFVIDYTRKLGIESKLDRDLSLALGSSPVSLLEITRAYGVYPAKGQSMVPIYIRRVEGPDGEVLVQNVALGGDEIPLPEPVEEDPTEIVEISVADLFLEEEEQAKRDENPLPILEEELPPDPNQIISIEDAYLATSMLRAVVDDPGGTGHRLRVLRNHLAGKTGTTNDQGDAWFVGFSPDVVTGVWVGHDEKKFLGYGETGSRAAAPIWVDFMRAALSGYTKRDFPVPDGIEFARIDGKTGLLAEVGAEDTLFQPFLEGTVPTKTADSARDDSESRRELRLDSF